MYRRPHYLKNAPGTPQILPQIQDGSQKSNMAAKVHKIIFLKQSITNLVLLRLLKSKPRFLCKTERNRTEVLGGLIARSVLKGQVCVMPVYFVSTRGLYITCR